MKEVKLTINREKLTFPFGLGFLGECMENLDLSVQEIGSKLDKNPFKWIPVLMHESHKYQCELDDVKLSFSIKELIKLLDNEKGNVMMNKFLMAFIKSLTDDVPKETTPKKQSNSKKK